MVKLKIMTFNIATCREPNRGIIDVARTIEQQQADLVLMQEVDKFTGRSGIDVDQLYELARRTCLSHTIFVHSIDYDQGQYGNGILSRFILESVALNHVDGHDQGETRSMGIVSIKIDTDRYVYVGVTHLEHELAHIREIQARDIIELYRRLVPVNQPFILAGDFNDEPTSRTLELLMSEGDLRLPCDTCPCTFPADRPTITIDYILINQTAMNMFEFKSYRTSNDEPSSDHLPLILEFETK
jgi:endonuclease/exonuclease/phosphatase family metal-dependent hydrolase